MEKTKIKPIIDDIQISCEGEFTKVDIKYHLTLTQFGVWPIVRRILLLEEKKADKLLLNYDPFTNTFRYHSIGFSKCHTSDEYDKKKGIAIAKTKAQRKMFRNLVDQYGVVLDILDDFTSQCKDSFYKYCDCWIREDKHLEEISK